MPQVLLTDFTRNLLPSDALVVSHLPGVPLVDAGFGPSDPRTVAAERGTGEVLAALHRLTGPAFGYPCGRQASSWAESFTGMIDGLSTTPSAGRSCAATVRARRSCRRHRPCSMTSSDRRSSTSTSGPATCSSTRPRAVAGVIDPERAFWGDPLANLVGIDPMGREPGTAAVLEGYGSVDVESPSARTRLSCTGCGCAW